MRRILPLPPALHAGRAMNEAQITGTRRDCGFRETTVVQEDIAGVGQALTF